MLIFNLLVESRLPVVGSLLSCLLNHLDDLLPGLAVLGEDVDIFIQRPALPPSRQCH